MAVKDLKTQLLQLPDFVQDNESLNSYIELVEANLNCKKEKFKHQNHHIIPRKYFIIMGLPVDNSRRNKVCLTHRDHVLAHYYLAKCCTNQKLIDANILALHIILGTGSVSEDADLRGLVEYQNLMEIVNKNRSIAYTGTRCIHLDNIDKRVKADQVEYYLSLGWQLGRSQKAKEAISKGSVGKPGYWTGKHLSQESKEKISRITSGGKYVFKGDVIKHVKSDALQAYLDSGWQLGNPNNGRHIGKHVWIHRGTASHLVRKSELENYLQEGYILGRSSSI